MVRPPTAGTDVNKHVVTTNYDKFQNQNAVSGALVRRFQTGCRDRVALLAPPGSSVLDVGAGEGLMTAYLVDRLPGRSVDALEYEDEGCAALRTLRPDIQVTQGSAYDLPWPADSFHVVTSFEVLEHLDDPGRALLEMGRVARRHVVLTVPFEPWFRVGNVARGRYVSRLGNTPGHLNNWTKGSLRTLMTRYFPSVEITPIFPWLLATGAVH